MSDKELYLDWFNNFLTIEKFAEYYDMSVSEANELIDRQRNIVLGKK